jgi:RHS repeat-associated protein
MGTVRYTIIDGEVIAQERDGVRHQLVPDPLGSTVALYDSAGTKTDTFSYWPYGESAGRTGTTNIKMQYIGTYGYIEDNSKNKYVRNRYLDSGKVIWISEDKIPIFYTSTQYYVYVLNSPVLYTDRLGLDKDCPRSGYICAICRYRKLVRKGISRKDACEAANQACSIPMYIDCSNPPPVPPKPGPKKPLPTPEELCAGFKRPPFESDGIGPCMNVCTYLVSSGRVPIIELIGCCNQLQDIGNPGNGPVPGGELPAPWGKLPCNYNGAACATMWKLSLEGIGAVVY